MDHWWAPVVDCRSQQTGKFLKRPDHLTCFLRNLYAGQQVTELDMEQQTGSRWGKEYVKTILSPCLFNLHAEYIMQNAELDEA